MGIFMQKIIGSILVYSFIPFLIFIGNFSAIPAYLIISVLVVLLLLYLSKEIEKVLCGEDSALLSSQNNYDLSNLSLMQYFTKHLAVVLSSLSIYWVTIYIDHGQEKSTLIAAAIIFIFALLLGSILSKDIKSGLYASVFLMLVSYVGLQFI